MSLASTYANRCGVKLPENPPNFPTNYIVCPDKFITLQTGSGMPTKNYDYYNEVMEILFPVLNNVGINVIQLGDDKDKPIYGTLDYRSQTSIRQSAFLIENALCHFGSDSCLTHIAGAKKTPFIIVCGNIAPLKSFLPHYRDKYDVVSSELEKNKRWSYNPQEPSKSINTIKPEAIAKAVLNILSIDYPIDIETLYIGSEYLRRMTDYVPDFQLPEDFRDKRVNCRLDLHWDLKNLQIALNFAKLHIVTKQPIDLELIKFYKPNIEVISYLATDEVDVEFCKGVINLGIQIIVTCLKNENLSDFRFKLLETTQVYKKKDNISLDKSITCDSFCKSGRIYIGRNAMYISEWHYQNDIKFEGAPQRIGEALTDDKFLDNSDSFYIFNQK